MTGSTASNMLPCRSRCGAFFPRHLTLAWHHAAAGRVCQLAACHFLGHCTVRAVAPPLPVPHWTLSRITHILHDGRELSRFRRLGQRMNTACFQDSCVAQATSPSRRAHTPTKNLRSQFLSSGINLESAVTVFALR